MSAGFFVTIIAMIVAPGPSFVVLVDNTLRGGRLAGLMTVAGSSTGLLFWAVAAALGTIAFLQASDDAFQVFKIIGAGYLCWLGITTVMRIWRGYRDAREGDQETSFSGSPEAFSLRAPYQTGLTTSLVNPKMATVYLALLPQFVPDGGSTGDVALLASIQISLSALWYLIVVAAVGSIRSYLCRPRWQAALGTASGSVLFALGVHTIALP